MHLGIEYMVLRHQSIKMMKLIKARLFCCSDVRAVHYYLSAANLANFEKVNGLKTYDDDSDFEV